MHQQSQSPKTLSPIQKIVYASGDLTVNSTLNTLGFVFTPFFLVYVADLRPALAGLVPLIGRIADAISDPLMGRISDRTSWQWGRRRPYFLIGVLPLAVCYSLLWTSVDNSDQWLRFLFYAGAYVLLSISLTVVAVPYLALIPEMGPSYDERTSLNAFRSGGAMLGVFAAIGIRPVADFFGGGASGYASAGMIYGLLISLPWVAVYAVSFENPKARSVTSNIPFRAGYQVILRQRAFRNLIGMFFFSRMAMDVAAALLILYFTYWIGRSDDFEISILIFFTCVLACLPFWLTLSRRINKHQAFIIGATIWIMIQPVFFIGHP